MLREKIIKLKKIQMAQQILKEWDKNSSFDEIRFDVDNVEDYYQKLVECLKRCIEDCQELGWDEDIPHYQNVLNYLEK